MMKSSPGNVLSMPNQQLYFGRGLGALTLTQVIGISLITLSPWSNASQFQPIQKQLHHRYHQITCKFTKMKRRKSPKGTLVIFFRGSVPKKPTQELQGRSSTEPKFGNCDEQSFVKSKPLTATPSKSQPLSGQLSKSKPETTLPIEENTERTTEKSSAKKRKREFKGHWKEIYPWLEHDVSNDVMYCMVCRNYPKLADITSLLYRGSGGIGK